MYPTFFNQFAVDGPSLGSCQASRCSFSTVLLVLQGWCTEVGSEANSEWLRLLVSSLGVFWLLLWRSCSALYP